MKSKQLLRTLVLTASSILVCAHSNAATYYWDTNANSPGLGDNAGTWGTSTFWGSMNAGSSRIVILGTQGTANTTIGVGDTVNFGTLNLGLGSTASTIAINGSGVQANRIVFGVGQGAQGVTLSDGGGGITLTNAGASIVANNTGANIIGAVLNGTNGLVSGGSGTIVLTGSNAFTGGITVTNGGTLQIGDGDTGGSVASQNLTFHSGGGTFSVKAADTGSTQAMGTLTFANTGATAGEGTIVSTYGTSGNAELSFSSLAARQGGATGNFIVSGGTNGTTNKIVLTGAATGFLNTGLYFGGSSFAAYDAGGFVRGLIYGTDTDAAATDTITASNHVQLTTSPVARPGDTLLSLHLAGGAVDYTMDSGTLTVPSILKSGGGALSTISGGDSVTTAANAEFVVRADTASDALAISTGITGTSGGLTKTGEGTLTLSGTNGYTGVTRVLDGTLVLNGGAAIADNQQILLANAPGATLQLNSSETVLNLYGGGFSGGTVNVQGNTLTLSGGSSVTFGGTYTGTGLGGIVKQGANQLNLTNKNTFPGIFTIEGGAVEFQYGNDGTGTLIPLSSGGDFNMADGTTLRFNPATNLAWGTIGAQLQAANGGSPAYPYGWVFANNINITSGTANFRVNGNENTVRFTGTVTGAASGTQTLAIYSGGIAAGSGDRQANTFAGVIQDGSGGTLGVNVDFFGASGTAQAAFVNLSGQNSFTGPLVVTNSKGLVAGATTGGYVGIGGEMYANTSTFVTGNGHLGGGNYTNTIALAAGTTLTYLSSAAQTLGGAISGGGALTKHGAGTLTLSGANSYAGATTVNAGILLINGDSSAATGNVTVNNGATLGGSGTTGGSVTVASTGNIAPGASAGTLGIGGNLNLSSMAGGAGTLQFELATIAASDKIAVTGTLSIGSGALDLNDFVFTDLGGLQNGTYTLITSSGITEDPPTLGPTVTGTLGSADIELQISGNNIVLAVSGLAGGTPYEGWATGSEAFNDDANGDGVDNGLAWILGASGPNVSALDKLPVISTPTGFLQLDFTRENPYAPAKLYLEYGDDLNGWTKLEIPATSGTIGGDIEVTVTAGPPDAIQIKIPDTHAVDGKLFARLSITEN